MLDDAGLYDVKIAVSNQLDEFLIKDLQDQKAPIDLFGVGTSLVTGQPDAALDGVYKLASADSVPRIKISEIMEKTTLPHKKQVFRLHAGKDFAGAEVVGLFNETEIDRMHDPFDSSKSLSVGQYEKEPLLHPVMENGRRMTPSKKVNEIAGYVKEQLDKLPDAYKRFEKPHFKASLRVSQTQISPASPHP